jgi:ABC-2 type transport system ATP-binding protein
LQVTRDSVVVEHVSKTFPKQFGYVTWLKHRGRPPRKSVVSDISFRVAPGELLGLLGANGAGKSTTLRMLAGLVVPDCGSIVINGVDGRDQPLTMRRHLGLCTSEERAFYFRLTARENLEYFGALAGLRGRELDQQIREVLELLDLGADIDTRFDYFSSGMRQRLAVARALLADPAVLLLDEPTRAVDPIHAQAIRTFVRDELVGRRGKTVILATNLLDEAWELCDRIAVLRSGAIAAIAAPTELNRTIDAGRNYVIVVDRVDGSLLERTRAVPGLLELLMTDEPGGVALRVALDAHPRTLTNLLQAVSANGISIASVRPKDPRPADVFAGVIGETVHAR